MVPKLIAAIACVILLLGLGARGLLNSGVQNKNKAKWEDKYSLKEIARRTKEEAKAKVTIPGPFIEYPGMDMKVDEALRDYSVVVAEVIAGKSYAFDSYSIGTWYRFRITDALSQGYAEYCRTC